MFSEFTMNFLNPTSTETKETDPFQLPIDYLDTSDVFLLNNVVSTDLELVIDGSSNTMYHHMMNPKTPFEENMIPRWKNKYTTNTIFLEETQQILKEMENYECTTPCNDYDELQQIWCDTKEDPNFLDRYSYMELDVFKWINKKPAFLQAISIINMSSPVLSFLIPFVFFLMPFIIVKMQGYPITFSIYMQVLKDVSRNHFIGKIINNLENTSIQNMLYLVVLIALYAYQIYQNYMACKRFYENIARMNQQICSLQKYLDYTIRRIQCFKTIIEKKSTYSGFLDNMINQCSQIEELKLHIQNICPFQPSFSKIGEIGSLLGCYYEIYSNREYGTAILYSFSFHGYIQNLLGIVENLRNKHLGIATFIDASNNACVIKDQYYPALIHDSYVINDVLLEKNMVITGPNAAGKTTYLKTTMLNIIFTQQFGCGFYSSCQMMPYTHIHSYLNIPDTSGRDSLFQAESRRCKEIIQEVLMASDEKYRHFCIFDELYSGTNPAEATKSAYSFLLWLSQRKNVDFILTTHYIDICKRFKKSNARICNWKMDAKESEDGNIEYTYQIVKGISTIQGAIKVLRDMDYPTEIIDSIITYDTK